MKLRVYVDVRDFKRLEKEIIKLEDKGKKYLSDAVNKAGEFAQRKMKTALPIDSKEDGLHLRDSLKLAKQKVNNKKTYQAALVTLGNKKIKYAKAFEFGRFKTRRYKGSKLVKKTIENNQDKIAEIVIGVLSKRLGLK